MKLALGTVQFGVKYGIANSESDKVSLAGATEILQHAFASGIDTLDTAVGYGDSEQRLGQIGVSNSSVISKLPGIPLSCQKVEEWVRETLEQSLGHLKINKLRAFLLHRPADLLKDNADDLYRALLSLKEEGLVEKIGISIYSPDELEVLCSRYRFDLVQAPFNILDRRIKESGWLSRLSSLDVEVHVRSVFLQGLLLMSKDQRPEKFCRWHGLWQSWHDWLEQHEMTALQACLGFALSEPDIDRVVVGVNSLSELKEIIQAADFRLPEVPQSIQCGDLNLISPERWSSL